MFRKWVSFLLFISLVASTLTGCAKNIQDLYPLESVSSHGDQTSYVYRASNKSVPEVAKEISDNREPEQISKVDPKEMFLVYENEWYNIQQDPNHPSDSLIEVDNLSFVQHNYDNSFLEGYITASIVHSLFDSLSYTAPRTYRGYTLVNQYHTVTTVYHTPSVSEKKTAPAPPVTTKSTGSITKRTNASSTNTVGSGDSVFAKSASTSASPSTSTGTIIKNTIPSQKNVTPSKSSLSPPKNNSPPKTSSRTSGSITRRR